MITNEQVHLKVLNFTSLDTLFRILVSIVSNCLRQKRVFEKDKKATKCIFSLMLLYCFNKNKNPVE